MMTVESLTGIEEEFFDFVELPKVTRPLPFPDYNMKLSLAFSISPDVDFI